MTAVVDRAFQVALAATGRARPDRLARPFGFAEPAEPLAWRVSQDVWDALRVHMNAQGVPIPKNPVGSRLLGFPIAVDEALPHNSMLLEER